MRLGDETLENKTRRMVYNHIVAYPGVSFNILKNVFELTDGALRYHLEYLEKNEKISSELDRGLRCYYPHYNGFSLQSKSANLLEFQKLSPQQERILSTIKLNPGINQKELIYRTRLTRFQVAKNLNKLQSLNLIRKYRIDGRTYYEYIPDDELKYQIMKRLVVKLLKDEIDEKTFLKLKRKLD